MSVLILSIASSCGDDAVETADPSICEDKAMLLSGVDETSSLGFSAADFLATIENPYQGPMQWQPLGYEVVAAHDDTTTTVTVKASYIDGEIRLVSSPITTANDDAVECDSYLEIELQIEFATADGLLDERWPVTVKVEELGRGWWQHEVDLDSLNGEFSPKLYKFDENLGAVVGMEVRGWLADQHSGSVIVDFEIGHGSDRPTLEGVAASW